MSAEKYAFTDRSPSRWCYFAIIDPADPTVWTHASLRTDGVVVTDFGLYPADDPRLTYWTPLPDLPAVSKPVPKTHAWLKPIAETFATLPRAFVLQAIMLVVFAFLLVKALSHWLLLAPLATLSWLVTPNTTWTQEFADLSWLADGGALYPPSWDKKRKRVYTIEDYDNPTGR